MSISENWPSPENEGNSPAIAFVVSAAHSIESWIGQFCRMTLLVTGLFLLGILTLIVVLRYWGGRGIDSGSELSALVFPVFVMAGIVEAARMGSHVATKIMLHALKSQWRRRLMVLIHSITAVVYFYLSWYGLLNAIIAHDEYSTTLRVPGSVGYGCLAIGLALVGICSLTAIVRHTLGKEEVLVNLSDAGPGVV